MENNMNFTEIANDLFLRDIHSESFKSNPTAIIQQTIHHEIRLLKFGDYLKRYICRKQNKMDIYADISDEDYLDYITKSFRLSGTPASIPPGKTSVRAAAKNWLSLTKCKATERKTVFLIGLGLGMKPEEVNELLTKGIYEQEINPKNPDEVMCWYCYQYCTEEHGHYAMYTELQARYKALTIQPYSRLYSSEDATSFIRSKLEDVKTVSSLMRYLEPLKFDDNISEFSFTAYDKFCEVYAKVQEEIAVMEGIITDEGVKPSTADEIEKANDSDDVNDTEKAKKITEGMIQNYLFGGLHKTKHGDLPRESLSEFYRIFNEKRLSKENLMKLLNRECTVQRTDLITLKFLAISIEFEGYLIPSSNKSSDAQQKLNEERCKAFVEETNQLLADCFMHPIIPQNPYEAFLLRCMAADDPREVYYQVLEQSYHYPDENET